LPLSGMLLNLTMMQISGPQPFGPFIVQDCNE
jgi:hypothetical protein